MLEIPIYQVDAFASRVFAGNPAAVCPLDKWLPDEVMQAIALENNLSETAFFVKNGDGFDLRWFTPAHEVDLCGHVRLARENRHQVHLVPQFHGRGAQGVRDLCIVRNALRRQGGKVERVELAVAPHRERPAAS